MKNQHSRTSQVQINIIALFLTCLFLISISNASHLVTVNTAERDYWPTNGWQTKTCEDVDLNETRISTMIDYAYYQNYDFDGILLIKDGYSILEEYPRYDDSEDLHNIYSITKSIISTLIMHL